MNSIKEIQSEMITMTQDLLSAPEWLTKAITPGAVRDGLLQRVPEFATGQLTILDCDVKRLRLRDGEQCWRGSCLLTISDRTTAATQTVTLHIALTPPGQPEPAIETAHHSFGAAEWRCYLPELRLALSMQPPRAKLAALDELTDPEAARRLLEESIRASGNPAYRNLRIQSCRPQVMRYKPGSRCTILYHLQYPTPATEKGWPEVVVAKTHHGDKGKIAYEGMVALWQSPMRTSTRVTIAEPLLYMPEERVLVQGPIREEMTLKDLVLQTVASSSEQSTSVQTVLLHDYLRKTAAGLAELHQCGVRSGDVVAWEDELAEIYESRAALATVMPHFADFADGLLDHLQQLAAAQPADATLPAHRSFRPAQVLLYQGEIGFIDFDGFCQAEPAMDLALFMTTMKNMVQLPAGEGEPVDEEAQLARLAQAEALCELFLTEYEKYATISRTRIALWETLQIVALVLGSWQKLKLERLEYCRLLLARHLNRHGFGEVIY